MRHTVDPMEHEPIGTRFTLPKTCSAVQLCARCYRYHPTENGRSRTVVGSPEDAFPSSVLQLLPLRDRVSMASGYLLVVRPVVRHSEGRCENLARVEPCSIDACEKRRMGARGVSASRGR